MRRWFYLTESRDRVAIPEADFFLLAEAGVIRPQSMVWTEGMDDWAAAGEIHPELFGDPAVSAPVDLPTVLQMVRALSAPLGRSTASIKGMGVFLLLTSLAWVGVVIFGTVVGVLGFSEWCWMILCALPLAVFPLLAAAPLMRVSKLSQRAYGEVDRGAFYGMAHSLGRFFWAGFAMALIAFLLVLALAVCAVIYRADIVDFIKLGMGAN